MQFAPSRANPSAMALPMPRPPPVTRATLFSNFIYGSDCRHILNSLVECGNQIQGAAVLTPKLRLQKQVVSGATKQILLDQKFERSSCRYQLELTIRFSVDQFRGPGLVII